MSKKSQIISLVFKAIIIIICGYGIMNNFGPGRWYGFNYYTVLSNTAVLIYFIGAFIWGTKQLKQNTGKIVWRPRLHGTITYAITITFLIYMFLLAPDDLAAGNFWTARNIFVHYIVPIMTILDWILFCTKGKLNKWTPIHWLIIPFAYFAFILARAPLFGDIGSSGSPYPYGFLDIQKYGWEQVASNVVFIIIGLMILGYLFYFIDKHFGRHIKK